MGGLIRNRAAPTPEAAPAPPEPEAVDARFGDSPDRIVAAAAEPPPDDVLSSCRLDASALALGRTFYDRLGVSGPPPPGSPRPAPDRADRIPFAVAARAAPDDDAPPVAASDAVHGAAPLAQLPNSGRAARTRAVSAVRTAAEALAWIREHADRMKAAGEWYECTSFSDLALTLIRCRPHTDRHRDFVFRPCPLAAAAPRGPIRSTDARTLAAANGIRIAVARLIVRAADGNIEADDPVRRALMDALEPADTPPDWT